MVSNSTDRFNGVVASKAIKVPCAVATSADITLSGSQTIDGVLVSTGDRVLVRAQTNAAENGIYDVKDQAWDRAADWDGNRDIAQGTLITAFDSGGLASQYIVETADPITIGSTLVSIILYSQGATVSVEAGTITDAMLRFDGVDTYRQADRLRATAQGAEFRWYASNLTDYAEQTYVGMSAIFSLSNGSHGFEFQNDLSISGADFVVTSGDATISGTMEAGVVISEGALYLTEIAAADTDIAGKGQLFVRNDAPNVLVFRNDDGDEVELGGGGGGIMFDSWRYDQQFTGPTDPGSEEFRMSSGTPSVTTALYMSDTSLGGLDPDEVFTRLSVGGHLVMQDANRTSFLHYIITSVTDNTTWWQIGVEYAGGNGVLPGDQVDIQFEFFPNAYIVNGAAASNGHDLAWWDDSQLRWEGTGSGIRVNPVTPPTGGRLQFGSPGTTVRTNPNINMDYGVSGQGPVWRVEDSASATDNFGAFAAFNVSPAYLQYEIDDFPYMRLTSAGNVFFEDWQTQGGGANAGFFWQEKAAAAADVAGYGQLWVNSSDQGLYYTGEAGADVRLDVITPTFNTPLRVIGDTDGAPPASQTALLEFYDSDESDRQAYIGYNGSNDFVIRTAFANNGQDFSIFHGGDRILHNEGTGGRTFLEAGTGVTSDIYIRPNAGNDDGIRVMYQGAVELYHNDSLIAQTAAVTSGGFTVAQSVTGPGSQERVLTETDRSRGWPCTLYQFDTSTTASDPGNGNFRFDNATLGSITEMYVDDNNDNIQASDRLIEYLNAGDIISFHRVDANNLHTWFRVTGAPTDNTGWWTVPVEYLYGTGFAGTEVYTLFPFHLSQLEGVLPTSVTENALLTADASGGWVEDVDARFGSGNLDIYGIDDLAGGDRRVRFYRDDGTLAGQVGTGSGGNDLLIRNDLPGQGIRMNARNQADNGDTVLISFDPDNTTTLNAATTFNLSIGGSTSTLMGYSGAGGFTFKAVPGVGTPAVMRMADAVDGSMEFQQTYQFGDTWSRVLNENQMDFMGPMEVFEFNTGTTMAEPTNGDIRFNSATPASVTAIAVSDNGAQGNTKDATWFWDSLSVGDYLIIKSDVDMADYWILEVDSITDNTTWYQIGVTVVQSGSLPSQNDRLVASIQYLSAAGGGGGVSNPLTADLDGDGFNLDDMGVMFMREQAAADADVAGQGQIWVENTTSPGNRLGFTDDAGGDGFFGAAGIELAESSARPYGTPAAGNGILWIKNTPGNEIVYQSDVDQTFAMLSVTNDFYYQFSTTTTAADPGSGFLRYDNATPASITNIYADVLDVTALGHANRWGDLVRGDIVEIFNQDNNGEFQRFRVNGTPVDNTGWFTIPVEPLDNGTLHSNNDNIHVQFHKSPSKLQDYSIENVSTTPTGTTETLTYEDGPAFEVDLESVTGNITITISGGPPSGDYGQIVCKVTQDSAVARTITWSGGTFEWAGGTAHTMTTTLNGFSIFTFETWDGGTTWFAAGADYS
jgi:hypothetical protein